VLRASVVAPTCRMMAEDPLTEDDEIDGADVVPE
jgi:hypothetical protein